MTRRGLSIACAWLLAGCAGAPWLAPPRIADCAGPLLPAARIPGGDFALRERVRVAGGGVELAFELLAERRADRLVVVALDAFGARIFSLVQQGLAVDGESPLGRALPVPPQNVLRDLHYARFAHSETGERALVRRPGCDYSATFVRVERRELR